MGFKMPSAELVAFLLLFNSCGWVEAVTDLIAKVVESANFYEGIVTTSVPCCVINSTIEQYTERPYVQRLTSSPTAAEVLPYTWFPSDIHEADFLQIDLRTAYMIKNVQLHTVQKFEDPEVALTEVVYAFSTVSATPEDNLDL